MIQFQSSLCFGFSTNYKIFKVPESLSISIFQFFISYHCCTHSSSLHLPPCLLSLLRLLSVSTYLPLVFRFFEKSCDLQTVCFDDFQIVFFTEMHLSHLFLLATVLLVLPEDSFECATNGLCGYQPTCGYQPQPPPSCGCARSYGCGSYGCYRLRARGAKSYQPKRGRSRVTVASSELDREVLKQRMAMERVRRKERLTESEELDLVSPSVARNRYSEEPIVR